MSFNLFHRHQWKGNRYITKKNNATAARMPLCYASFDAPWLQAITIGPLFIACLWFCPTCVSHFCCVFPCFWASRECASKRAYSSQLGTFVYQKGVCLFVCLFVCLCVCFGAVVLSLRFPKLSKRGHRHRPLRFPPRPPEVGPSGSKWPRGLEAALHEGGQGPGAGPLPGGEAKRSGGAQKPTGGDPGQVTHGGCVYCCYVLVF